MPDKERLIKAWEIFRDSNPYEICDGREFLAIKEPEEYCMGQMISDTIAILKDQEVIKLKTGHWIESKCFDECFWVCSECNFPSEAIAAPKLYNYCPNCGAKMS